LLQVSDKQLHCMFEKSFGKVAFEPMMQTLG